MLDHLVGRPSPGWKRIQVIVTLLLTLSSLKSFKKPPKLLRWLDALLQHTAAWKIIVGTWAGMHFLKNTFLLFGLNGPEPLSKM